MVNAVHSSSCHHECHWEDSCPQRWNWVAVEGKRPGSLSLTATRLTRRPQQIHWLLSMAVAHKYDCHGVTALVRGTHLLSYQPRLTILRISPLWAACSYCPRCTHWTASRWDPSRSTVIHGSCYSHFQVWSANIDGSFDASYFKSGMICEQGLRFWEESLGYASGHLIISMYLWGWSSWHWLMRMMLWEYEIVHCHVILQSKSHHACLQRFICHDNRII